MSGIDLEGKVAIVTGGGRGMGRSMAIALVKAGAKKVNKPSYKDGTWYELPDGRGFGIRNIPSVKSSHYGTNNTIDVANLGVKNLEKIKY